MSGRLEWRARVRERTVRQGMDTHTEVTQRCFRGCRAMIQGHREGVPDHSSETSLLGVRLVKQVFPTQEPLGSLQN